MNSVGVLLSILPLTMWGTGDYIAARLSKKMSPFATNWVFSVYGFLLPLAICLVYGFPHPSLIIFSKYMLANIMLTTGFICMVKGFSKGAVGIIAPIANAYAVITLLVSVVLFDVSIKSNQIAPSLLIVLGVIIVIYQKTKKSKNKRKNKTALYSVLFGLGAMLFFGISFALLTKANVYVWYQNQMLLSLAGVISAPILMLMFQKRPVRVMVKTLTEPLGMMGGLIASLGTLGLFAAIAVSKNVVLVATIASAAPLCTALLAYKLDHERLRIRQRVGTVLVVGGVVLLNVVG